MAISRIDELEKEKSELRKLCRDKRVMRIVSYEAFGREFKLPHRFGPPSSLSGSRLKLLKVFFALHGSICLHPNKLVASGASLGLQKKLASANVLHMFGEALGGSIYRSSSQHNLLTQPHGTWRVNGTTTLSAAKVLSSLQSPQQSALSLLASLDSWPQSKLERAELSKEILKIRWNPACPLKIESTTDLAHLVDASGSLHLHGIDHNRFRLFISCPSTSEFDMITEVVKRELGSSAAPSIRKRHSLSDGSTLRSQCVWCLTHDQLVKDLLTLLLGKLELKHKETKLALSIDGLPRGQRRAHWHDLKPPIPTNAAKLDEEYLTSMHLLRKQENVLRRQPSDAAVHGSIKKLREAVLQRRLEVEVRFLRNLLKT